MNRLLALLGMSLRTRFRGFVSAGASSIFLVIAGLFNLAFTCAMGVGAWFVLSQSRGARVERFADLAALIVTMFGVFYLTRPLILTNLAGASLQNLLHLPIRRGEMLAYSLFTGVITPLVFESPVLIGAALGAASSPALVLVTLPLALLAHLTLLAGAHTVSLIAVLMARRAWISDLARLLAISVLFLPYLINYRGPREFMARLAEPLAALSPLGWAARATVYAGGADFTRSLGYAVPALLLLAGTTLISMHLLNRILAGEGADRVAKAPAKPRPARIFLPGALGALVETQMRSQLRTPAARMALFMPALMMGFLAFSLARSPSGFTPVGMVVFLSVMGGNAFLIIGRGIAMIVGTPVARASILVASDIAGLLFRLPPLLAIIAVVAWRGRSELALSMTAVTLALIPISLGVQHFVSILRPFALPSDRLNPFAHRVDARQSSNGVLSLIATLGTVLLASPFLLLVWLSPRIADGAYLNAFLSLAALGSLATYAVLIAIAERLFAKRELQVLEVLLDDSAA